MKQYAIFAGCKIPYHLKEYGRSTSALLDCFMLECLDIEFNCCGYPVRDLDFEAFVLSGARNLALAEQQGVDIVTPCKCCYGSLKFAEYFLSRDESTKTRVNQLLQEDELRWEGRSTARHLLSVLHDEVGLDTIRSAVKTPFKGLKTAVHVGCHALRPSRVTKFDDAFAPRIFDALVRTTGAESVHWSMREECCGNPQMHKNKPLALNQMHRKLFNAEQSGADIIGTACTYCQIQFDQVRRSEPAVPGMESSIPSILVSHLIGLSIGLDSHALDMNRETEEFLNRFL